MLQPLTCVDFRRFRSGFRRLFLLDGIVNSVLQNALFLCLVDNIPRVLAGNIEMLRYFNVKVYRREIIEFFLISEFYGKRVVRCTLDIYLS